MVYAGSVTVRNLRCTFQTRNSEQNNKPLGRSATAARQALASLAGNTSMLAAGVLGPWIKVLMVMLVPFHVFLTETFPSESALVRVWNNGWLISSRSRISR